MLLRGLEIKWVGGFSSEEVVVTLMRMVSWSSGQWESYYGGWRSEARGGYTEGRHLFWEVKKNDVEQKRDSMWNKPFCHCGFHLLVLRWRNDVHDEMWEAEKSESQERRENQPTPAQRSSGGVGNCN